MNKGLKEYKETHCEECGGKKECSDQDGLINEQVKICMEKN